METKHITEQALNDLGEEFAERIRRGEKPSIAEFASRYSADQSEEIFDFLDSIAMLEDMKSHAADDDEATRADEIPQNFGRYRIERSLGEGGMGTVYLAHDSQLDRKVALKTPKFARNSDPNLINRFYREARSAATLQHPNICPVYDVGEIDGRHYISMAYIQGRPLSDLIRSKSLLAVTSVVRIVRKVALALQEAHVHGLIHRDLKPANIMIGRRNEPIVMDFGLARQFDSEVPDEATTERKENFAEGSRSQVEARLTMDGTIVGSPGYMSPEQLRGEHSRIGPVCDVYALGVLLYELLTRELPFPGDGSLMSVVNAVLSDPTPDASVLRPQLDLQIVRICRKAMAKNAEDRYGSMLEFAAALTKFLNSNATTEDTGDSGNDSDASRLNTSGMVRTKEQYELAKSLYQEHQYAAAVSILEKMVGGNDTQNEYVTWANKELPRARAKAADASAIDNGDSGRRDEVWNEAPVDLVLPAGSVSSRYRRNETKTKRRSGFAWYGSFVTVCAIGVLLLALNFTGDPATDANKSASARPKASVAEAANAENGQTSTSVAEATASPTAADETNPVRDARVGRFSPERLLPAERLQRLDVDDDGKLTKQELDIPRIPPGGVLRRVIEEFDRFDISPKDGALDKFEIQRLLRLFARSGGESAVRENGVRPRRTP